MAETPEQKTLNEISERLKEQNINGGKLLELREKSMQAFPAEAFKTISQETGDAVKAQRAAIDKMLEDGPDNTASGLAKFLGVDFKSEFFGRLKKITAGFKDIKTGLGDLGKALGLGKVKNAVGGFWDFLKTLIGVGLATVGFIEFLEGWNNANEIFGKQANFGERLSAGLANVIGSFAGLTDGEVEALARDINDTVQSVLAFLSTELKAVQETFRASWPNVKIAFTGLTQILEGEFLSGINNFSSGISGIATNLIESESILAKAVLALAAIKIGSAAIGFAGAIGPIFTAISSIVTGIGTIFAAVGGKAAFIAAFKVIGAGAAAATGGTLAAVLVPLALALGAVLLLKGTFDGFKAAVEEYKNSGDPVKALKAFFGTFFDSIIGVFKNIYSFLTDQIDTVVFKVKDFLGLEMTKAEQYKSQSQDVEEQRAKLVSMEERGTFGENQLRRQREKLASMEAELQGVGNAAAIDNQILNSGVSTFKDYIQALEDNKDLTTEQRLEELREAREAREKMSFQNFQVQQNVENKSLIAKIKTRADRSASFTTPANAL